MPAMNPTGNAMSVVMYQFSPNPATDRAGVERNIARICDYVDRAVNSFPGVDLIVVPEYTTHGFGFDPYASHLALASSIPPTRREAGCLHYDLYRTTGTPSAFVLFERYRDSEALEEHRKTEHYKSYRAVIANLLKDPIQVSVLQDINVLNQSSQGTPLL